jgi:hypothetical protein
MKRAFWKYKNNVKVFAKKLEKFGLKRGVSSIKDILDWKSIEVSINNIILALLLYLSSL